MTKPNEERSLDKFETNMDKHRQKIFMQLNGFKLNAEGEYEYDEALKIPVEDLRNPEHENYDSIFAAACDKVDALREATQSESLNLQSTASVWHYIARANNWTNEGGYAYDGDLGPGEYKVFGGGGKFNANSSLQYTGAGGMSIDPNSTMKTMTGVDYDWTKHKDDARKNVAVLVPGEPDWESLPPEEKGGKGDQPIDVQMSGKQVKISGPSLLMVPPINCEEGEVYCGGRCAVIQGGVATNMVNCICLGACDDFEEDDDNCNGFKYGENQCCNNAKYCRDGKISCGNEQCLNGSAETLPLPREAALAYNSEQTELHDKYGIPTFFCKPEMPESALAYPNADWVAKAIGGYGQLTAKDANFYIKFLDGLFNAKWSNHCVSPIATDADEEIIIYSDNVEETYISVGIEELHPLWTTGTDNKVVDHTKFVEYTKSWRLGTVTGMDHPHFRSTKWTINDQPCSTQNCAHEKMTLNPDRDVNPGPPVEYDRWVISIWTTSEETGYQKITAQQYATEEEGHILWKIPSYGFVKYMIPFPWMATYDQATIHTRCGEESSLITGGINLG